MKEFPFHFAFSFAGEDRPVVEVVKTILVDNNVRVFYDFDHQPELLGKDLAEYFSNLFQNEAEYCVIFLSKRYLKKAWCKWERRAALSRAFKSRKEYIIPYFLERVKLPSLPDTIGRAEAWKTPPEEFAQLLLKKLYGAKAGVEVTPGIFLFKPKYKSRFFLFREATIAHRRGSDKDILGVYASIGVKNTTAKEVKLEGHVISGKGYYTKIARQPTPEVVGGYGTIIVKPRQEELLCFKLGSLMWSEETKNFQPIIILNQFGPRTFLERLPKNISYNEAEELLCSEKFKLFDNLAYTIQFLSISSSVGWSVEIVTRNGDMRFGRVEEFSGLNIVY